jgi:hypothetical protein
MAVTLETRKPIVTLQADDLEAYPIWEFCLDEEELEGRDETWIRPLDASAIPKGAYALSVAATLTTASGFEFKGFVAVDTAEGFEVSGFALPFPRYCFVTASASDAEKAAFARIVGVTSMSPFPVRYRVCAMVEGEQTPRVGQIS